LVDDDLTLARLLIVEDDEGVRRSLGLALREEGYHVDDVPDAEAALEWLATTEPDLVLVDIMLPRVSGLELCRAIRRSSEIPIILVTARDDSHDVVAGLEAGADDYVTKPFVFKELAARVRALLRRARTMTLPEDTAMDFDDLRISPEEGRVLRRGEEVELTRTEFLLLCQLASRPRRVLSRDQLLTEVWGYDYFGDGRVVDAHIRRLRTKIEDDPSNPEYVRTVRGLGYKFEPSSGERGDV
jgi:DNA-binding response OmpR family regulator